MDDDTCHIKSSPPPPEESQTLKRHLSYSDISDADDEASEMFCESCKWSSDDDGDDDDVVHCSSDLQERVEKINAIQKHSEEMIDEDVFIATISNACVLYASKLMSREYEGVRESLYTPDQSRILNALNVALDQIEYASHTPEWDDYVIPRVKETLRERGISLLNEGKDVPARASLKKQEEHLTEEMSDLYLLTTTAANACIRRVANRLDRTFEDDHVDMYRVSSELIYDVLKWSLRYMRLKATSMAWTHDTIPRVEAILRIRGDITPFSVLLH